MADEAKERQELLETLHDANKRMAAEKAAKKRDAAIHNENIKAIDEEIEELLERLKQPGD